MRTPPEAIEDDTEVSVGEVDQTAARANLDSLARRFLDMSGEEFLSLRERKAFGEVQEQPGFTRVLAVATLIDCARSNPG
ncbi:MAG: hypothetical protein ACT4NY_32590 [Pseudonocardiales bacterium]